MKTLTFYSNTRYAGGRSHRNIHTIEFVEDMDIFEASEHYAYHIYPSKGDDFEGGVNDWNGNEVMDAEDFKSFTETGIGRLDFGDTVIYSCELEDIDADEFDALPQSYQIEYIQIYYEDVTQELLEFAADEYDGRDMFNFTAKGWQFVREEMAEEDAKN